MQPDVEIRLKSMIKAMTDVVLPAVDATNAAAVEQARLVTASLGLIAEQVDYFHCYAAAEAQALCELARSVAAEWPDESGLAIECAAAAALATAARADLPTSMLTAANRALREALCTGLEEQLGASDDARRARIERVVLAGSVDLLRLERAFVAKTGFDVAPQDLSSIGRTLDKMRR